MNAPLRRAGVVVLVLFGLLFANLNWVQGVKARDYRTSEYNGRVLQAEYEVERGKVIVGGEAIAQSVPATSGDLKFQRVYPKGAPYAHVVGYKSVVLGSTGIEKLENDYLSGNADSQFADRIEQMFTGEKPGGNVVLTISKAAQETAYDELVNNKNKVPKAAAVAIDPKSGAILAAVSIPSYDPNTVVTQDRKAALTAQTTLNKDENKPLRNRGFSERYPPGSTFKVVMSAAMLVNGETPQSVLDAGPSYAPPQTGGFVIRNASPNICPEAKITLIQALTESCNTAFAKYGAEVLGADKIKDMAKKFGFESVPAIDLDEKNTCFLVAESITGTMQNEDGKVNPAFVAQSSIGQKDVVMTPLQGALIAATVANGGKQMRPYLVQQLKAADLTTVHYTAQPKVNHDVIDGNQAGDLQQMMISVVNNGSGKNARISGFQVGGKTGTAENATEAESHGWFISFAMKGNEPVIATAVFLENAGKGGSAEAARIAGQIMKAYIGEKGLA
jgi:peptidoglycan glycosyltransferase